MSCLQGEFSSKDQVQCLWFRYGLFVEEADCNSNYFKKWVLFEKKLVIVHGLDISQELRKAINYLLLYNKLLQDLVV